MTNHQIITERDALAGACTQWAQAPWIALDTEFVREETYYPRLCLIQITDERGHCSILDALALGDALTLLCPVIASAQVLKVIHAASQDLEVLYRLCGGTTTASLFDTQIAAALLGLGDQISYAALVEKRSGLTLDKSLTRTDWSRRPLTDAELSYAAADVLHLAALFPALRGDLEARGRSAWLAEECLALAEPARYQSPPQEAWRRVKGFAGLDAAGQAAGAALAAWRETTAQRRDRPRRWILSDEALFAVAQRRPQTLAELERLQALPPKTLQREGQGLLAILAGVAADAPALMQPSAPLSETQRRELADWQGRVRALAQELDIPAPMLASRADLEQLVRLGLEADLGLREGWRGRVSAGLFGG